MEGADSIPEIQELQEAQEISFDFELHYGLSWTSVRDFIRDILSDLSTYKHIHNWDEKLLITPLDTLASVVRKYLSIDDHSLTTLLSYSMVEEVLTIAGVNYPRPAMQAAGDLESFLLFTKVSEFLIE
jgi:hypothetical protein